MHPKSDITVGLTGYVMEPLSTQAPDVISAFVTVHDCPNPEVLAAYAELHMTQEEWLRIDAHVSGCERCRSVLRLAVPADEQSTRPRGSDGA